MQQITASSEVEKGTAKPRVSIGIFAWNEEDTIANTIETLFAQNLFEELAKQGATCEIICVVNGCTDSTPQVAAKLFAVQSASHPGRKAFSCRVANLQVRGKLNAWNEFVHKLSAKEAACLIMMDADIVIHRQETLWNMVAALEADSKASVTVDRPRKHLEFKPRLSGLDCISLAMSRLTGSATAQLCGQLYCIRSDIARNIYLPKDLAACEDGFIKALVCTDFLSRASLPDRIRLAPDAEHTFDAYTSPRTIFKNQKRQMIGQAIVHILVDQYLTNLPASQKLCLADFLKAKETSDSTWLRRLITEHLQRTRFWWQLYPGLLTQRFRHFRNLSPMKRVSCFPAALASSCLAIFTSYAAWKHLQAGSPDYWPKAPRAASKGAPQDSPPALQTCLPKP